jgi:hypothetical protein
MASKAIIFEPDKRVGGPMVLGDVGRGSKTLIPRLDVNIQD